MKIDWSQLAVLIVEDDKYLREILVEIFQFKKCRIFVAENGVEALQIVNKEKTIDIVVSDVRMPEMTGIELLKKIREINSLVPIVILATGFTDVTDEQALSMGAAAVFHKPFNLAQFVTSIEGMIDQRI